MDNSTTVVVSQSRSTSLLGMFFTSADICVLLDEETSPSAQFPYTHWPLKSGIFFGKSKYLNAKSQRAESRAHP